MKATARLAMIAMAGCLSSSLAVADGVEDFYRGRTVNLIVGFPTGGGYDANIRLLQRFLGKFIPGRPNVVVANMPGAGSLTAVNHLARSAAPDGLTLGMFAASAVVEPLLGNSAALFDPLKLSWIGSVSQDVAFCGVWRAPGAPTSFDDIMKRETLIGGGGAAAITYQHPMVLKNVIGAKMKVVNGYAGTRDIFLAMNRGEVNGGCGFFTSSIQSQWAKEVSDGQMKLVIQMGAKETDVFGAVPSVFSYAKSEEERAILDVHFRQLLLARPLAGPPGVPADRLAALRRAFFQTLDDPEFRAEAAKSGVDVDPVQPDDIIALLNRFAAVSPDIRRKALEAMGR